MSASSMGVLASCIARKQWQNAANIAGCSIDALRRQYDTGYVPEYTPVTVQVRTNGKAVSREVWLEQVRVRMHRLRVSKAYVSVLAGLRREALTTFYSSDWGPSPHTRKRIEVVLDRLEIEARS